MSEKVPSEDQEQMEFVQWFRRTHDDDGVRIFAIPSGGHRHIAVAAKMKCTGTVRGVPDLCVPEWHLWIEMKRTSGGRVSSEQHDWHGYLRDCGDTVLVCYGCDDAIKQVESYKKGRGLL